MLLSLRGRRAREWAEREQEPSPQSRPSSRPRGDEKRRDADDTGRDTAIPGTARQRDMDAPGYGGGRAEFPEREDSPGAPPRPGDGAPPPHGDGGGRAEGREGFPETEGGRSGGEKKMGGLEGSVGESSESGDGGWGGEP